MPLSELDLCGVPAKKISAYAVVGCGGRTCATHVQKKTAHPRWDQKFALTVGSVEEDLINLVVYSKDKELGSWTFGVCELVEEMGGNMQGWVVLCPPAITNEDVDQGRIRISVKFMPSETRDEGPVFVKVKEVSLLVDDGETADQGAVAAVVGTSPPPVNIASCDIDVGAPEGEKEAEAEAKEEETDPTVQVGALTEAYVLVYTLFDEVKKWQGQLDVALVLTEESQKRLLQAFTVLLEAVGSQLQERVNSGNPYSAPMHSIY